jgi:nitrite reductase (NADH) small subunit
MLTLEKTTETLLGHGAEVSLGSVAQIPSGEGRVFPVNGIEVAVFHTRSGQVYAVQAECPHRMGPLADGLVGGTIVMCPFHSRKFDLTTGIGLQGDCNLQTYPVRLDTDGSMWLTV